MEKFGTVHLKKGLSLAFAFGTQTEVAFEDKKFTLSDIPGYFDELMQLPGVIEAGSEILDEALDISPEERTEIDEWAKTQFNLTNDDVEEKVEAGLDWIMSTLMLKKAFAKKSVGNAPPA